jgi:hypothetical protein
VDIYSSLGGATEDATLAGFEVTHGVLSVKNKDDDKYRYVLLFPPTAYPNIIST